MMELLKRFEESEEVDEDEDEDPLAQRLKGTDLGTGIASLPSIPN